MMDSKRLFIALLAAAGALWARQAPAQEMPLHATGMRENINSDGFPRACITFNDDLSRLTPLDLRSMVAVDGPDIERAEYPLLRVRGNRVCMNNLKFGSDYRITFRKGLSGDSGRTLGEDLSISFTALSMVPRAAAFPVRASARDGRISFNLSTVNLKSVRVCVAEVPKASLRGIAIVGDSGLAVGTQKAAKILSRGYTLLSDRVVSLPAPHDTRASTFMSVPAKISSGSSYLVLLLDPLFDAEDSISRAARGSLSSLWGANLFMNTPLSVIASRSGDTATVSASLDPDARPAAFASVELLDKNGVQLDASVLDSDGETSISHLSRFEGRLDGAMLRVSCPEGEIQAALPESSPRTQASSNGTGIRVAAATDRTSCMPGDTITYVALARTGSGKPPASGSLHLDAVSPDGTVFKRSMLVSQGYGAYEAAIRIPSLDRGGTWKFRLVTSSGDIADERSVEVRGIGRNGIYAEYAGVGGDLFPGAVENLAFRAMYPGGIPAYGIIGSASVTYTNDRHPFDGYKEYAAGPDPAVHRWDASYPLGAAYTSDDGIASFQISVPSYSYPRKAVASATFQGQGEQPARTVKSLHIAPSDNICGVRIGSPEGRSVAYAKLFSPQGKPVSGRIYYKISKLEPMPYYVHRPDGWRYEFERVPVKINSGAADFNASRDASGEIFLPSRAGMHLLELATASGLRTSISFVNGFTIATPGEHLLKVKAWSVGGGRWAAQFQSPYDGRGILTVESPYGRETKSFEIVRGTNTVGFSAPKGQNAPMHVEVGAFFKSNEDLAYIGRGEAMANDVDPDAGFRPVVEAGERTRGRNGDSMVLRLRPQLQGIECSYLVMAVSTPYVFHESARLDTRDERMLDSGRTRTAYSRLIHSPRGGEEMVEIPLGAEDQRLDVKVLCWNQFYSGKTEKSFNISFPARIQADPIAFLNAGDVAAPEITVSNSLKEDDFTIKASCTGAATCATSRKARIAGGGSYSFLLPVTARGPGRASMRVSFEGGGYKRELRRDFDVINPWPPMAYTELVPLEAGERRIYSSDVNFSPISRGSISCGPMPYTNRSVLTSVLLSRHLASPSDNIMAALGLVSASKFSANSETSIQIQSRVDRIAASVRPDGTLAGGGTAEKYGAFHSIAASLLMHRAAEHGYAVGPGVMKALDRRRERLEVTQMDPTIRSLLLYVRTMAGRPMPRQATRDAAVELLHSSDMISPAAVSMLAVVLHEVGDDDEASLAISLAITRVRRIMLMQELFDNGGNDDAFPGLYRLMDCRTLPIASPQTHAAAVIYAIGRTGLTSFMEQALALFRYDGFFSSSRAAINSILLSLSGLQDGRATETAFPESWDKVTLQNRTSKPVYCTAAAYGYDLDKPLESENLDLKVSVSAHNRDDQISLPRNTVRVGDDFVLAIDVRSKKQGSSFYKITIPLMPGLKFERVLKGLDPHYMKLGPLSLVLDERQSEREVTLLAYCRSGVTSRIALLMRPQMRGRFVFPSVEVAEQHRLLKSVYWGGFGRFTVE
jgi:hypothetical protein